MTQLNSTQLNSSVAAVNPDLGKTAMVSERIETFASTISLEVEDQWKEFLHCLSYA
jgi:hypothetical protein